METQNRMLAGVALLALALALVACGPRENQDQGPGTLEVASVPPAEIWIDGASKGTTPQSLTLDPGNYDVVLKRDAFVDHQALVGLKSGDTATVDATLVGEDPGDPAVIQAFADVSEIAMKPFEEGERHRGGSSDEPATLLWPQKDVRVEGLRTFGVEVSLDYLGDGYLEFKDGREVLYREAFKPGRVTTVLPIPASVLEAVKKGDTITWGIVFEQKRDNVVGKFKVVSSKSAAQALAKLERRKFYRRQPALTQALMRAQVLQNKSLFTESLLANLAAAQAFPNSTQPYRGIVTALRRLDAKDSALFAAAAPFVDGRGAKSRIRPTPAPRPNTPAGQTPPLDKWNPGLGAVADQPKLPGTGGDVVPPGLRPTGDQPGATDPAATTPEPGVTVPGGGTHVPDLAQLREREAKLSTLLDATQDAADAAAGRVQQFETEAQSATEALRVIAEDFETARGAHEVAQTAFEQDPSDENRVALEEAQAREQALAEQREQAETAAQQAAQQAESARSDAERTALELKGLRDQMDLLNEELRHAGLAPDEPGVVDPKAPPRESDPLDPTAKPPVKGLDAPDVELAARAGENAEALRQANELLAGFEAAAKEVLDAGGDLPSELLDELQQARQHVDNLNAVQDDLRVQQIEGLKDRIDGEEDRLKFQETVEQAQADLTVARELKSIAESDYVTNPTDAGASARLDEAKKALADAETALDKILDEYEGATQK